MSYGFEIRTAEGKVVGRETGFNDTDTLRAIALFRLEQARAFHGLRCEAYVIGHGTDPADSGKAG